MAEKFSGGNNAVRYFILDHLGTVAVVMNESGGVVERNAYDAWGKRRVATTWADDPTCSLSSQTTRGYTGHEQIDAMCLVNMNARIYDSTLGRFMTPDSLIPDHLDAQSYNRYSYVENHPLSALDPTGHAGMNVCGPYSSGCYPVNVDIDRIHDMWNAAMYLGVNPGTNLITAMKFAYAASTGTSMEFSYNGNLYSLFPSQADTNGAGGLPDPSHVAGIGGIIDQVYTQSNGNAYFRYYQDSGKLYVVDNTTGDSTYIATGYSGAPGHVNDSTAENLQNIGPIPTGLWTIGDMIPNGGHMGPNVLPLTPSDSTYIFGRQSNSFFMHGDSISDPGTASQGCVIMDPVTRSAVYSSGINSLQVYKGGGG